MWPMSLLLYFEGSGKDAFSKNEFCQKFWNRSRRGRQNVVDCLLLFVISNVFKFRYTPQDFWFKFHYVLSFVDSIVRFLYIAGIVTR